MALRTPVDESVKFAARLLMSLQQTQDKAPLVTSSEVPRPLSFDNDSEGDEDFVDMILWTFNVATMKRYGACRRSGLSNSEMNRMMSEIIGHDVSNKIRNVLSAAGKLYTGHLVETALEVMSERNDSGSISPEHITEAHRRLMHEEKISESSSGRNRYLKARRQIFKRSSTPRPFNTHDRVMQSKL